MRLEKHEKESVLMLFVLYATFVKRDVAILEKNYKVDLYQFNTSKKIYLFYAFIKQFFFLLFNFHKYKTIVIQSSGYLSFLPVIFGQLFKKPIIIIAIGTDCAKLPEINYGAHTKQLLSWFTNFSFKNASLILPVHKSLENSFYSYLNVKFPNPSLINNFALIKKSGCPSPLASPTDVSWHPILLLLGLDISILSEALSIFPSLFVRYKS